jgi:hypothetical protein
MSGKAGLDLSKSRKAGRVGASKKLDYSVAYRPPDVDQHVLDAILTSVKSLNYKNRDTIGRDNRTKNSLVRGDNHHDVPGTHSLTYSLTHLFTYSLTHLLTHSLTHSLTHLLTHSLTHSLTHLLTYSLTHLLTHSLTYLLLQQT